MLVIAACIEGINTRSDGTLKVAIGTNELPPADAAKLLELHRKFCYVAIKPEDFGRSELEAIETAEADFIDDNRKTESQRLRDVLFVNWKNDSKGHATFKAYYFAEMERIIGHYKSKLP